MKATSYAKTARFLYNVNPKIAVSGIVCPKQFGFRHKY